MKTCVSCPMWVKVLLLTLLTPYALLACRAARPCAGSFAEPSNLETYTRSRSCDVCLLGLRPLDKLLHDPNLESLLVNFMVKEVCPRAQTIETTKCLKKVANSVPDALKTLRQSAVTEHICQNWGACRDDIMARVEIERLSDPMMCSVCLLLASEAKVVLTDPETQAKIMQSAEQFCATLPDALTQDCLENVKAYAPQIFSYLESVTSQQLCEDVNACQQPSFKAFSYVNIQISSQPEIEASRNTPLNTASSQPTLIPKAFSQLISSIFGSDTVAQPRQPFISLLREELIVSIIEEEEESDKEEEQLKAGDESTCNVCKVAVVEAKILLSNPDFQAQLLHYAKELCGTFPAIADDCTREVEQYGPLAFGLIVAYLNPDQVCTELNFCPPPQLAVEHIGLRSDGGDVAQEFPADRLIQM